MTNDGTHEGENGLSRRQALGVGAMGVLLAAGFEGLLSKAANAEPLWWHPFPAWALLTTTFDEYSGSWYPYPGPHQALDYDAGNAGEPVYGIGSGTVQQAGWSSIGALGYTVQVNHGGGYVSHYAHLNAVSVSVGTEVQGGQTVIGLMGGTGGDYAAHLHLEIWTNGSRDYRIDPLPRVGQGYAPLALTSASPQQNGDPDMMMLMKVGTPYQFAIFGPGFWYQWDGTGGGDPMANNLYKQISSTGGALSVDLGTWNAIKAATGVV